METFKVLIVYVLLMESAEIFHYVFFVVELMPVSTELSLVILCYKRKSFVQYGSLLHYF